MPATCNQLVAEVVWRDVPATDRPEPHAYVLTSDDAMRANVVSSVTSAVGPHCGTAYPSSRNEGDMLPYLSGTWDTAPSTPHPVPTGLELYVARTGGIYANAEWLWRYTDDAVNQYRGWHDPRYSNLVHTPFSLKDTVTQHHAVCYSRAFNRVICVRVYASQFKFAIRTANTADPTVNYTEVGFPTTGSFPPNKRPSTISQGCPYSALVELADGSLRLLYAYIPDTVFNPTLLDIDMLGSTDGGMTWSLLKEGIITELFGAPQIFGSLRAAVSGDWMRLEIYFQFTAPPGYTNTGVYSMASGDRGATWVVAQEPDGTDNTAANTDTAGRYEVHDIEGLGTLDGRFIRVRCRPISFAGDFAVLETCTRDGAWDGVLNGLFSAANLKAVWLARGGAYLLLLPAYDNGAGVSGFGGAAGQLIPLDTWNDASTYIRLSNSASNDDLQGLGGIQLAMPKYADLAWVGDRWAFLHAQLLRALGTGSAQLRAVTLNYFGGYSRRPVTRDEAPLTDPTYQFTTRYWSPEVALVPAGGTATETAAGTPWQSFISAGTTYSTTDYTLQMTIGRAVGATGYFREQLASTGNTLFADHGVLGFRTRAATLGTVPIANLPVGAGQYYSPQWGCYVASQSALTTGNTFGVGVHLTGDGRVGVYDAAAGATLYVSQVGALAGITTGTWYDVRLAMASGSLISPRAGINPTLWYCEVAWSAAGDNTWSSTGLLTLTSGTPFGFGSELYDIGHMRNNTGTTGVYEWREFWFSRDSHYANTGMLNPDNVRGVLASSYEQHVAQGVHARWGGNAGFTKDTFTSPARWQYGADQLLTASPASHWRSTSTTAQTIVLDAQLAGDGTTRERFQHSGFAVLGTNSRYVEVEYASDAAFTYPTRFLLDGLRYTCQVSTTTAIGTEAMHVDLTGSEVELVADGELAGHYLRAARTASGRALRIAYNAGNRVFFDTVAVTQPLSYYGIITGRTVELWASSYTATFDDYPTGVKVAGMVAGSTTVYADVELPRYMRVNVRSGTAQGEPAEGYWRIGSVVAGLTLPITVPLNWQHSDSEDGNVQLTTAQSGVRSAYVAGAPRRTVKGTSEGDVERWRVAFRGMARTLAAYSANPVVLVQDDQQKNLSMLYSRFIGSTELANAGWRYDTDRSRWEQVGDLAVTFEEEV